MWVTLIPRNSALLKPASHKHLCPFGAKQNKYCVCLDATSTRVLFSSGWVTCHFYTPCSLPGDSTAPGLCYCRGRGRGRGRAGACGGRKQEPQPSGPASRSGSEAGRPGLPPPAEPAARSLPWIGCRSRAGARPHRREENRTRQGPSHRATRRASRTPGRAARGQADPQGLT